MPLRGGARQGFRHRRDSAGRRAGYPAAPTDADRAEADAADGTPAVGSIGFGAVSVSGRSRVPRPPTSRIASMPEPLSRPSAQRHPTPAPQLPSTLLRSLGERPMDIDEA